MEFSIFDLGLVSFNDSWSLQHDIFNKVKNGKLTSALLLCQHYPVITLGRLAKRKNILISDDQLKSLGIPVYEVERGGDVTYHGPGQIIAYPIFNLNLLKKDIRLFLWQLEEITISLLREFKIDAKRNPGYTGVWVDQIKHKNNPKLDLRKIASIGIAIRNWITFHGLSVNIKKFDLSKYTLIKPCGLEVEVTSIESILGRDIEVALIKQRLAQKFKSFFGKKIAAF
jgi:lipoate-protein ligase B